MRPAGFHAQCPAGKPKTEGPACLGIHYVQDVNAIPRSPNDSQRTIVQYNAIDEEPRKAPHTPDPRKANKHGVLLIWNCGETARCQAQGTRYLGANSIPTTEVSPAPGHCAHSARKARSSCSAPAKGA